MNSKKFLALACVCIIIILSFVCFSSSQENNNNNNNHPRPRPSGRHPRPEPTRRPRPQPSLRPRPEPSQQPRPQPSSRRPRPEPTKSYTLIEVNNPLNETLSPKSTKQYTLKLSNKQKVNLFYMQYGKNLKTSISIELSSKARNVEGTNVVIVGKTLKGNLLTCSRHTGCTYTITVTNNDEGESNNVLIQSVDSIATINGCNERPEATTASEGTRGRKRSPKGTIIATAVLGFLTALLIVCVFALSLKLRKVKKELALLKKNVAVEQTAVVPNTELNEVESVEETNNLVQAQNNTFMNSQPVVVPQQFVNYTQYPQMYPVLMVPNTTHPINIQPINTQQKE
ncbi:hypothetical protein ABK040_002597 [Willaertia magna]